jgi:hypothetical protein
MRGCVIVSFKERTVSYNITLLANRVLEIVPLRGATLPTRVRFALRPAVQGGAALVALHLEQVSPQGAQWHEAMRDAVARWAMVYLGCRLALDVPHAPDQARREATQGELGIRTPPGPAEPGRR